jgi:hypothetical protein
MAINVCRFQPELFVPIVEKMKRNVPIAQQQNNTETLIAVLRNNQRLSTVIYDVPAFDACRKNN